MLTLELLGGVGVQDAARLIVAWAQSLDLPPAAVVGHSMGGQIALYVAAFAPERVSRLVLACASGLLHAKWWKVALNLPRAGFSGRPRFMPVVAARLAQNRPAQPLPLGPRPAARRRGGAAAHRSRPRRW